MHHCGCRDVQFILYKPINSSDLYQHPPMQGFEQTLRSAAQPSDLRRTSSRAWPPAPRARHRRDHGADFFLCLGDPSFILAFRSVSDISNAHCKTSEFFHLGVGSRTSTPSRAKCNTRPPSDAARRCLFALDVNGTKDSHGLLQPCYSIPVRSQAACMTRSGRVVLQWSTRWHNMRIFVALQ